MSILKFEHFLGFNFWVFCFFFPFFATAMKEGILLYMYEPKKKSSFSDVIW